MRSALFVVLVLTFAAGSAAQTYRARAPRFERLTGERLRLSAPRSDPDRALVFPCKPVGQGCASNPLAGGRVVFEGPAAAWQGFQVCQRSTSGDLCVPFERVFGAPAK